MTQPHETRNTEHLQGPTAWLLPSASAVGRKVQLLRHNPLLLFITAIALILPLLTLSSYLAWRFPELALYIFSVQVILMTVGLVVLTFLKRCVRRELLEPLAHLRNWAMRIRGGNLSSRIPVPPKGEFAELAKDINKLSESLQNLSQNLDDEVKRQTDRIAQKTRSLQVLYDVAASLNVSRDLKDLLTRFLHTMRDIVNAKAGTVRMLTENDQMEIVASIGLTAEVVERERLVPVQRCLCGNAVSEGEVLFQADLRPCGQFIGRPMLYDEDLEMIAVPLQYRGQNLGVYNLFVEKAGLESREDLKALFTSIGRHLGMAIEKARLDNESKRLSIMQERTTLAHELHDSLAQTLASLRFQVSMLNETLDEEGKDAVRQEIQQIKGGLDEAYTELRELLAHFRAPIDARGLLPALEDLVASFRKQTGMHVLLQKEWDASRLPATMEMQVLRILQEALANIRKHSQAQTVRVMLRCDHDGNYRLLVEDDGVGLREPAFSGHPGEHIGLSIMQERARYLGGKLRIESEEGEGTRVLLTFRYPEKGISKGAQPITLVEEKHPAQ